MFVHKCCCTGFLQFYVQLVLLCFSLTAVISPKIICLAWSTRCFTGVIMQTMKSHHWSNDWALIDAIFRPHGCFSHFQREATQLKFAKQKSSTRVQVVMTKCLWVLTELILLELRVFFFGPFWDKNLTHQCWSFRYSTSLRKVNCIASSISKTVSSCAAMVAQGFSTDQFDFQREILGLADTMCHQTTGVMAAKEKLSLNKNWWEICFVVVCVLTPALVCPDTASYHVLLAAYVFSCVSPSPRFNTSLSRNVHFLIQQRCCFFL